MAWKFFTAAGAEKIAEGALPAMVQLYDNTLTGATASWDVSTGLTGYNHLQIVLQARSDVASNATPLHIRLNNDSGANYDVGQFTGSSGTASNSETFAATSGHFGQIPGASAPAGLCGAYQAMIPNYAGAVLNKAINSFGDYKYGTAAGNMQQYRNAIHWRSTAAINRVTLYPASGNFIAGSRLTIYGLL